MTRTVDDYDYDSIRDADYDDYDAEIYRWQASGWEPYGGEIDDGGNYFTELRRPKWVGRLIERVAASERGRWATSVMVTTDVIILLFGSSSSATSSHTACINSALFGSLLR